MDISCFRTNDYLYINAFNEFTECIGKVGICLNCPEEEFYQKVSKREKVCKIIYISVSPSHRANGVATALMKRVIKEVNGFGVFLDVIPMDGLTVKERLIDFYKSFGFVNCYEKTMFLNC